MDRVTRLVETSKTLPEWGDPHLATTPKSVAIEQLARELDALRDAVKEITGEVQRLSART
jgi:hypothetical protein